MAKTTKNIKCTNCSKRITEHDFEEAWIGQGSDIFCSQECQSRWYGDEASGLYDDWKELLKQYGQ